MVYHNIFLHPTINPALQICFPQARPSHFPQLYQVLVFENILESINFAFHMRVSQFCRVPSQLASQLSDIHQLFPMTRTTERNGNREIINIGAAIIRNTQRMHHLNLFVFFEAIFEPPLTVSIQFKKIHKKYSVTQKEHHP